MQFIASLALYVDPGSGSMVLQLLLGGVSGIYVIFRLFKQRILGIFGIKSDSAEQPLPVQASQDEDQIRRPIQP